MQGMAPVEDQGLEDRRVLVAGGGSGIGAATARALAAAGCRVLLADRDLTETAPEQVLFQPADLTRRDDIDRLFQRALDEWGGVDVLISCAGVGIHERLSEGDPDIWARVFDTNLMAALRLVRAFVPAMLEAGEGDVVMVSSVAARQAYPWGGIYAASKAALAMAAETLRQECLPAVRVLTVTPGVVDTPFFDRMISGSQSVESMGFGSVRPEQIADLILYALSRPPNMALNDIVVRPRAQPF